MAEPIIPSPDFRAPAPATLSGRRWREQSVILLDDELGMCQAALRHYLGRIRNAYRKNVAVGDQDHADSAAEKYDRYLDLFARVGGDPDELPAVDDPPSTS